MKIGYKPELYKKTVDILFNAYFNDTLEHGNYCGCAVGNLVAANMNIPLFTEKYPDGETKVYWFDKSQQNLELAESWFNIIRHEKEDEVGQQQLSSTGYDNRDLYKIEKAFEGAF